MAAVRHQEQPPPSRQAVQDDINAINRALIEIIEAYRWSEAAVYGTGGGEATDASRTPTHESRPAENQALSAVERSASLRETARLVSVVRTAVTKEARRLRPKPATTERPDRFPPLISPAKHDELTDAKRRREERGEGWGRG